MSSLFNWNSTDRGVIRSFSLQSGSNGNCYFVETEDVRLLIDAGLTGKTAQQRMMQYGYDIHDVDALIISHSHSDHIKGAGVFHRKFGIPVYITSKGLNAGRSKLGPLTDVNYFRPGETIVFGETKILTIPTPHDAVDSVIFVVEHFGKYLGIFTDLGHCFDGLSEWISRMDGLYLESNYDPDMLENSDYPNWLKRRIIGDGGHISNQQAADLIEECQPDLQFLALSHLSENNNDPTIALETMQACVAETINVAVAPRVDVSQMFIVE